MFRPMLSPLFAGLMLSLCLPWAAQAAVVEGQLQQYQGGAVVGAKVLSYGAKAVSSNKNGQFKLNFAKAKTGDRVLVTVNKPGLVVVNELEMSLPLAGAKTTMPPLLLASSAQKQQALEAYLKSRAEVIVAENYRLHRIKLMNGAELPHDEQKALEQKRQDVLGHADRLIQQLLVWDPIEGDPTLRDVFRLYLAGDLEAALKLLPEDELFGGILLDGQSETEQRQVRISNGQALRLRGNLLLQQFRFNEADMAYKKAELINPNTYRNWMDNAEYFHAQNQLDLAATYYQKALFFAQNAQSSPNAASADIATAQAGLAMVHHAQQQFDAAHQEYSQALVLRRNLARANPKRYRVDLAALLFNVAVLHTDMKQPEQAKPLFEESRDIFKELAAKDAAYNAQVEQVQQALDGLSK